MCKIGSHKLYACEIFMNMSPQDRIEQSTQLNLYKNCLSKHNNVLKGLKGCIKMSQEA